LLHQTLQHAQISRTCSHSGLLLSPAMIKPDSCQHNVCSHTQGTADTFLASQLAPHALQAAAQAANYPLTLRLQVLVLSCGCWCCLHDVCKRAVR
jgi:hypothetical protein